MKERRNFLNSLHLIFFFFDSSTKTLLLSEMESASPSKVNQRSESNLKIELAVNRLILLVCKMYAAVVRMTRALKAEGFEPPTLKPTALWDF